MIDPTVAAAIEAEPMSKVRRASVLRMIPRCLADVPRRPGIVVAVIIWTCADGCDATEIVFPVDRLLWASACVPEPLSPDRDPLWSLHLMLDDLASGGWSRRPRTLRSHALGIRTLIDRGALLAITDALARKLVPVLIAVGLPRNRLLVTVQAVDPLIYPQQAAPTASRPPLNSQLGAT